MNLFKGLFKPTSLPYIVIILTFIGLGFFGTAYFTNDCPYKQTFIIDDNTRWFVEQKRFDRQSDEYIYILKDSTSERINAFEVHSKKALYYKVGDTLAIIQKRQ